MAVDSDGLNGGGHDDEGRMGKCSELFSLGEPFFAGVDESCPSGYDKSFAFGCGDQWGDASLPLMFFQRV
jgi:hypothetical protein